MLDCWPFRAGVQFLFILFVFFWNLWKNHPLLCLFLPLPVSQRSKISLGSKALSHDSVFVSDSSEANEALGASQDSIHGKVKSLQVDTHEICWGSCVYPDLWPVCGDGRDTSRCVCMFTSNNKHESNYVSGREDVCDPVLSSTVISSTYQ